MNQTRDLGFKLKISHRLIKRYYYGQFVLKYGIDWHYEWLKRDIRELWTCDLNSHYCCDSVDYYGVMDCGCYGLTYREYWEYLTK